MGNICVIGPRNAGKTTYLAALAYGPNKGRGQDYKIRAQNPESRELAVKAEDILCQGLDFEPTGREVKKVDDLPFYSFGIETNGGWRGKSKTIQLTARDYPGEVFEKIAEPSLADSIHKEFIQECFTDVVGCLIFLTGWEKGTDSFYNRVMRGFLDLMDAHERARDLKLAVAMSKCERGEIWPGRLDPETDLFSVHLSRTRDTLRDRLPEKNLRFFAVSTFGVLGRNNPRPNREDRLVKGEPSSVLREAHNWRPYNTVAPLYWLNRA